jgi:hypothetical protein
LAWQPHLEGRLSLFAVHLDRTAVCLGDLADDEESQAESATGLLTLRGRSASLERLEDLVERGGLNRLRNVGHL